MKRLAWLAITMFFVIAVVVLGYRLLSPGAPLEETTTPVDALDVAPPSATTHLRESITPADATETALPSSVDNVETIIILHTNDFHGAIEPKVEGNSKRESGGLVNLVSLIDQIRAEDPEHTLLLDAGDTFQGTYVSNSTQGEVIVTAMNVAGYDAWTPGNHGFDWGQDPLRARIAQAEFPALAANLLDVATEELWEAVKPYTIVQVGQAQVAILGLTNPDTPAINKPQNVAGLDFRGAVETARRYLPELESQADLIVVLSHLGYNDDRDLAAAVAGIDVIVGGHSHAYLERPDQVNGTIIVQAGDKGQVLGKLALTVDLAAGEVTDYTGVLRPARGDVSEVNQDVAALVDTALEQAAETMGQPIGETVKALAPRGSGESALGNLVADAMLAADLSDGRPADIAMHNTGGIRAELPKGPVTFGQLYAVLPFDNQLMALDLTGEQVLRILEHSVAEQPGKMLVSGMAFHFNTSQPVGQRILEATVGGEPLDPKKVYRVVTIDYLASGGDGQATFLEGTNPTYGDTEVWVVAEYIRAHSPVDPKLESRIVGR